jgi:capsular exopolysaccharide synthesis family protein
MKKTKNAVNFVDLYNQESSFATEFRRLLHNVNGSRNGTDLKTLLVTSAMLSEGKSTITSFLAITAAQHKHKKTLLIDCDLRRPVIHHLFNLRREKGVCEILREGLSIKETIKKTSEHNLDIITCGKYVAQPTEVLNAASVRRALEEVKFYYDFVLLDSPPVLPVSDPMMLSSEVDGVLLVVKAGSTQREVVKRATELIRGQSRLIGVVLNNLDNVLPYYYNESYYGYEYSSTPPKKPSRKSQS